MTKKNQARHKSWRLNVLVKIAPIVLKLNACAIQYALVLLYNPDPHRAPEINCPQNPKVV